MIKTKEKGLLIVVSGPSGCGKSTLDQLLIKKRKNIVMSISDTTRSIRENEVNGVDYYFMNKAKFKSMNMFEVSEFRGWYYGISEESLSAEKINIGVFNPDGVRTFYGLPQVDLLVIYIDTDDKIRLMRQLNREEYPDVREIVRRFSTDEEDFSNLNFEYFKVYNNNLPIKEVACEVMNIIEGHRW